MLQETTTPAAKLKLKAQSQAKCEFIEELWGDWLETKSRRRKTP